MRTWVTWIAIPLLFSNKLNLNLLLCTFLFRWIVYLFIFNLNVLYFSLLSPTDIFLLFQWKIWLFLISFLSTVYKTKSFPGGWVIKNPPVKARRCWKIPQRRKWQITPWFLPWEIQWTEEPWQATVCGVSKESDTT